MKQKFDVTGMTCSACSAHVEKAVGKLEGIQTVNVNLLQNSMVVEYDDTALSTDDIINAVKSGGYGASVQGATNSATQEPPKNVALEEMKVMKKRLVSSFCFLIPLFYVSMGHMVGAPLPSILLGHENMMIFALTQLLLATPVLIINKKFFVVGFQALWNRAPNMDSLVALGSAASYIYSIFAIYAMAYYMGHGRPYDGASLRHGAVSGGRSNDSDADYGREIYGDTLQGQNLRSNQQADGSGTQDGNRHEGWQGS